MLQSTPFDSYKRQDHDELLPVPLGHLYRKLRSGCGFGVMVRFARSGRMKTWSTP